MLNEIIITMCSTTTHDLKKMEGDLADIVVRATGGGVVTATAAAEWQFTTNNPNPINFSSSSSSPDPPPPIDFGHPFTYLRDPLNYTTPSPAAADHVVSAGFDATLNLIDTTSTDESDHDMKNRPSNMFTRMLQISPSNLTPNSTMSMSMLVPSTTTTNNNNNFMISSNIISKLETTAATDLQISSHPPNTTIKRRKSQANKIVCVPAPALANSRPSGEVVPSDLWGWRKYGQKPIKGSPYPRGYYRCSSSKGCSARKQVERSRTDPNMLVITYTSEHNHPWPTQRNALAGSTRTHHYQPTKSNTISTCKNSTKPKQKQLENTTNNELDDHNESSSLYNSKSIKEEELDHLEIIENAEFDNHKEYQQKYEDSFFADLEEIEAIDHHPLQLLFTQGFSSDDRDDNKSLDPFSFYDWVGNTSSTSTAKRDYS